MDEPYVGWNLPQLKYTDYWHSKKVIGDNEVEKGVPENNHDRSQDVVTENENVRVEVALDSENDDEVYVSDDDSNYKIQSSDASSEGDYESEFDASEGDDDSCHSDFEEVLDIVAEVHSDEDMSEIYVERGPVGHIFEFQPDGSIKLEVGQLFLDVNHFREVLKDFAIQDGFELHRIKNEKSRVTCKCLSKGCKWRIHASPTPDGVTYKIKTYQPDHNCIRTIKNNNATSTWIAKKLESMLMADPNITYATMKQELLSKYGLEPTNLMQLYRAKRRVHQTTRGVHALSYNEIPPWAVVLRQTNKGNVVKLEVDGIGRNPQFKRLFICLDAMKKGFVKGCRPWFGIDGCHLKGPYGGILLSAVSLDGNKGMFPIAIAVVEIACKDSWRFFLTHLCDALNGAQEWTEGKLTIMSDMQKGLTQAVADIFPKAKHRFCCNHMLNHFKLKFRSLMLLTIFWNCAMAYNEAQFDKAIENMRKISTEAANWMTTRERPKHMWARYLADPQSKSDHVTNNICEAFNGWLGDDRRKTILAMVESLHLRFMKMIQTRHEKGTNSEHSVTPRVRNTLAKTMHEARFCHVAYAGNAEYQVMDRDCHYVVNLESRFCGCNYWTLTGLPCRHACASIGHGRGDVESYVHEAYSISTYVKTYSQIVHPMPEVDPVNRGGWPEIDPPTLKRLPGRPRKARKKSEVEGPTGTQLARRSNTIRCSTCNQFGHNYRTCQRAPVKKKKRNRKLCSKYVVVPHMDSKVGCSKVGPKLMGVQARWCKGNKLFNQVQEVPHLLKNFVSNHKSNLA